MDKQTELIINAFHAYFEKLQKEHGQREMELKTLLDMAFAASKKNKNKGDN